MTKKLFVLKFDMNSQFCASIQIVPIDQSELQRRALRAFSFKRPGQAELAEEGD